MARKETITKNDILNTAFDMTREEGFTKVSARTLAARAGCSTQPIFRVYKNMEELGDDLFTKSIEFFSAYYDVFPKVMIRLLSIWDLPMFGLRRKNSSCSGFCSSLRIVMERVFMIC